MEQQEFINKYELIIIIDGKLSNDDKKAIAQEAGDMINKAGGKVINNQLWLEKHKLTFFIKKRGEGTYYLINFECGGLKVEKIRSALKLNEKILRFSIMKAEESSTVSSQ